MALENDTAGADSAPADDLRSQLAAAFESHDSGAPSADEPASLEPPVGDDDPIAAQARADRARDPKGRFAKPEGQQPAGKPVKADAAPAPTLAAPEGAQDAPTTAADQAGEQEPIAHRPPPGWSPAAKAAFDELPPAVKEAVARREDEVNKGFAKLADYKGLEPYAEITKRAGLSVADALGKYMQAEKSLQENFLGGVQQLCKFYGVNPQRLGQVLAGNQPQPQQRTAPQQRQQGQQPAAHVPPQVIQEISSLKQTINSLVGEQTARQRAQMGSVVEEFFADPQNKYADNVAQDILDLVSRDQNARNDPRSALKRAYERAVWANAETRAELINEQVRTSAAKQAEAARLARSSTRSITGAPGPGTALATAPQSSSLREELLRNWNAAGGRV